LDQSIVNGKGAGRGAGARARPKLSIGLPIYNGQRSVRRVIDSVLGQTFRDLELVISDNASTDQTAAICREVAAADGRLKFHTREQNAGIVANFNRALELSSGEYFRWIGGDDWLEPSYAEKCVAALDARPDAVGVTNYLTYWSDQGERNYYEYHGPRVDSSRAHERFERCLWFMHEDFRNFDPMYSMHRRAALERTHGLRPILNGDQMLAAELSLLGPYVHLPESLANRGQPKATREAVLRLLTPPGEPPVDPRPEQFLVFLNEMVQNAALTRRQKLYCYRAILLYYWEEFETTRVRPLRIVLGKKLRELGIPVDRVSPFR
jgi:glycosyltransferase involved in cell wall biosynthesis